jgi:hypothetical protein
MTGDPDLTTASESYNTLLQPSEMKDMVSGQPLLDHELFWLDAGGKNSGTLQSQSLG